MPCVPKHSGHISSMVKNYPLRIIVYLTLWAVIWAGWRKGQIPFYFHSPGIFHRLMGWVLEVTAQNLNKWVSERNWASTSLCHQSCQPLARCHWLPCCLVCLNKPAAFPFFVDLTDHWQIFHKLLISDHLETCYFFISLHSCTESFFFSGCSHGMEMPVLFVLVALGTVALRSSSSSLKIIVLYPCPLPYWGVVNNSGSLPE